MFVKTRGNLSELQKELGISYPTAKARLEELIAMGYESETIESREKTLEILEKIEGEITQRKQGY